MVGSKKTARGLWGSKRELERGGQGGSGDIDEGCWGISGHTQRCDSANRFKELVGASPHEAACAGQLPVFLNYQGEFDAFIVSENGLDKDSICNFCCLLCGRLKVRFTVARSVGLGDSLQLMMRTYSQSESHS